MLSDVIRDFHDPDVDGKARGRNIRYDMPIQLRGYLAEIDLPQVEVRVSSNRNHPDLERGQRASDAGQMALATTEQWAEHNRTHLAVNANFYKLQTGLDLYKMSHAATEGLSLSAGHLDQPPFTTPNPSQNPKGWVALLFTKGNEAHLIENFNPTQSFSISRDESTIKIKPFLHGVAGTWLLKAGGIPDQLEPESDARHARMAIGTDTESPASKLYIVMFELQTALPRSPHYLLGEKDFVGSPTDFPFLDARSFASDTAYEQAATRPVPEALHWVIDAINDLAGYTANGPLRRELCKICPTVEDEWQKPDEKSAGPPLSFASRTSVIKNAWKIRGRSPDEEYVVRLKSEPLKTPRLVVYWKTHFRDGHQRTRGHDVSVGLTLWELAHFMLRLGVKNAVNLDGSGSAAFVYTPPSAPANEIRSVYHDGRPASDDPTRAKAEAGGEEMEMWSSPSNPSGDIGSGSATELVTSGEPRPRGTELEKPGTEMYHLEQHLRPRPTANHIGFYERSSGAG